MATDRPDLLRRCASESIPMDSFALSFSTTPATSDTESEELVEVTIDFHDDETVVLRRIVPAAGTSTAVDVETPPVPSMRRSSSSSRGFRQFSQELTSEAMAKARRFSHDLTTGLSKRFSWSSSKKQAFSTPIDSGGGGGEVIERAIAAREIRKKKAVMDRAWSGATLAMKGLRFISTKTDESDGRKEIIRNFDRLARDGFLARSEFGQCIGMKESKEFALELFDALSRRRMLNTDKITIDEFLDFWSQITDDSFDSRLQIFFDMVDKKGNGRITEPEVKEIIMLSASSNRLARLKEQAEEYAALIMEELDSERFGYIELWQLETLLLQKHTYLNSQTFSYTTSQTQTSSQNLQGFRRRSRSIVNLGKKVCYYFQENWQRMWVLVLWIIVMLGLFTWKFYQYKNRYTFQIMGYCVTTAKGAAETLKFNMALILLPVSRNTITWLRSTRLGHCVPFNDSINFHKTVAAGIIVGTILHAGNHLACDFPRLLQTSYTEYTPLMDDFGEHKPTYMALVRGTEGVTGVVMIVLMAFAFILATRWFRRSAVRLPAPLKWITGFNSFWYSHHLFVLVYILLVIHGQCLYLVHDWYSKTTWMYLAVPILIYAGERMLRAFRSRHYSVNLRKVAIYPGDVLTLHMTKPPAFKYKSGQYIFVKCPAISPFEWHPFSITSAPDDDYLSIHIRQLGDWTEELKNIFSRVCLPPLSGNSGLLRADESTKISFPKLFIDGAYGAPAQDYRKYDVLLLVGLGIGATPFISILKDLLNNIVKSEEQSADSTSCFSQNTDGSTSTGGGHVDSAQGSKVSPKTKKTLKTTNAYFYWVTREQGSFDWFKGIMNEIADLDQLGIIELHNHLTSVYEEGDARSALITLVQSLNHARNGVDILSGTRVRTHFARPNWNKVFARTCRKHPNARIGVFYCGSPVLIKDLNKLCTEYNQRGTTKFELHKEHF